MKNIIFETNAGSFAATFKKHSLLAIAFIGFLLILTMSLSCVSLNGKTVFSDDIEIIGNVSTTFVTYQPLHIITEKHKINILKKAYSQLLAKAQYEYGAGVDVVNINIKGAYSFHNLWFLPVAFISYGAPFILQNLQRVTVTGNVISLENTESQNNNKRQSRETGQSREPNSVPQLGAPSLLQQTLNQMPAVPIAGNNLKFEFGGDVWIAKVNGRNFLAGTIKTEETNKGVIMTLKQTHTYPPKNIPGVGWLKTPGPDINLEYKMGPPASLQLYSNK